MECKERALSATSWWNHLSGTCTMRAMECLFTFYRQKELFKKKQTEKYQYNSMTKYQLQKKNQSKALPGL